MARKSVRRRKPDSDEVVSDVEPEEMEVPEEAAEEVAEEVVETAPSATVAPEPEVTGTPLQGPFRANGINIVDRTGRPVAQCGRRGDMGRTGPGIAATLVELLNRE